MQRAYPEIQSLGWEAFFIGPETEEAVLKMMEKTHATIPLLYDLDGSVMEAYKLVFTVPEHLQPVYTEFGIELPQHNAATGWRLPIPATFIVDQEGIVRARYQNADYRYRMEPADILAALRKIVGNQDTAYERSTIWADRWCTGRSRGKTRRNSASFIPISSTGR